MTTVEATTDGKSAEFTNKHLHQAMMQLCGYLLSAQCAVLAVVVVSAIPDTTVGLLLGGGAMLASGLSILFAKAANGSGYARSFFEVIVGEPIDWAAELPEVNE